MALKVDAVVLGAGCVGLAISRSLSKKCNKYVLVLDRNHSIGMETSSRSSEVIHRGMYYSTGSLKHQLCISGRQLLLDYLRQRHIPVNMCGKIIVASDASENSKLDRIYATAIANGVDDLVPISASEVKAMEPAVECHRGLYSPNTGTFDSHAYMLNLHGDIEAQQSTVVLNCTFESATSRPDGDGFDISTSQGNVATKVLINAGGLSAVQNASNIASYPQKLLPRAYFAKGNYFRLEGASPFSRLIYPLPGDGGLGVHCTLDMQGAARFGPDVEWIQTTDTHQVYEVSPKRASVFTEEIAKYWPGIRARTLLPDYAGIRPKVYQSGLATDEWGRNLSDFVIEGSLFHGVPNLIQLFGIESPGLTASLAIAELVTNLVKKDSE